MIQNLIDEALGHYRILQPIEQGGMASVFLARDIHIQREVAIKVFQPQEDQARASAFLHRFNREAQIVGRLDHPNILQIYDYGEQDGLAYLVMPYLANGSLKQLLAVRGCMPIPEALQIISQLLEALQYAHDQGLIHRDIKPGNILFKNNHTPVLADFGLVKEIASGEAFIDADDGPTAGRQPTLSSSMVMGTPYYMAPEQIRGHVQPASDIYSTAVVLYEMLTGQHPLIRERTTETVEVLLKQLNEPPLPIRTLNSAIPPHLSDAIMRALAKDPALRYQRPLDFLQALRVTEASLDLAPVPIRQDASGTLPLDDHIITTPPEEMTSEIALFDQNRTIAMSEDASTFEPVVPYSNFKITRRWVVGTLIAGGALAGIASLSQMTLQRSAGHAVPPTSPRPTPAKATAPVQAPATQLTGNIPSTKQAKLIYRGHTYDIKEVAWSSFSNDALIASTDGNSVHVWRAQDGVRLFSTDDQTSDLATSNLSLGAESDGNCDLAWSPVDPRELTFFVASQDNQHTPYLWKQNFSSAEAGSVSSMGPVIQLNMTQPYSFVWSPDGYYVAIGSTQGVTIVPDGKDPAVWNFQQKDVIVNALAWSPDGKYLAFITDTTQIWDVSALDHTTNTQIAGALLSKQEGASSLAWSPNGKLLAIGTQSGPVQLWDISQRKIIRTLGKTGPAVRTIAWSPDGKYITWTNSGIRTVGVWNTTTGEQVFLYLGHALGIPDAGWRIGVESIAWSPDGKYIASGDQGGTVHIWAAPH